MAVEGKLIEENVRIRRFEVDHNFDGWRLDKFLANRISGMSRSLAGRVARDGSVEVEPPRKVKAGTRLRLGDRVEIREELEPEVVQDAEVDVPVLERMDHLVGHRDLFEGRQSVVLEDGDTLVISPGVSGGTAAAVTEVLR